MGTYWYKLLIGKLAESMNEPERALLAYERALYSNPYSEQSLTHAATLCRQLERFPKAIEYFQRILKIHDSNGEVWAHVGHCYLMLDELNKAYSAYQQVQYLIGVISFAQPKRTETLVRNRDSLRSIWEFRACRRCFCSDFGDGSQI